MCVCVRERERDLGELGAVGVLVLLGRLVPLLLLLAARLPLLLAPRLLPRPAATSAIPSRPPPSPHTHATRLRQASLSGPLPPAPPQPAVPLVETPPPGASRAMGVTEMGTHHERGGGGGVGEAGRERVWSGGFGERAICRLHRERSAGSIETGKCPHLRSHVETEGSARFERAGAS